MTAQLIPIFPLSNVVLFPRLSVPLHIFEPRYRQMTEAALEADGTIGMATVIPEEDGDLSGDPTVFSVGCAGVIRDSQRFPDGRYNIVLEGTRRFRVQREQLPDGDRLYRLAEVEWIDDALGATEAELLSLRARLLNQVDSVARRMGREDTSMSGAFDEIDDETLANSLANAFGFATREKQGLLEANTVRDRIERLSNLLDFALAELDAGNGPNSGALH